MIADQQQEEEEEEEEKVEEGARAGRQESTSRCFVAGPVSSSSPCRRLLSDSERLQRTRNVGRRSATPAGHMTVTHFNGSGLTSCDYAAARDTARCDRDRVI